MIDWDTFKSQMQSNPKRMLGFVLGIALCFLLIWMLVVMQTDTPDRSVAVEQSGRLDSLRISLNQQPAGDSLTAESAQNLPASDSEESGTTPFANAVPTFLILLAAIGGLWYWIKKGNSPVEERGFEKEIFTSIGSQKVLSGNEIAVIKINREFWILGSGGEGLNLLHRFSEDEWNGPDVQEPDEQKSSKGIFKNILDSKKLKEISNQNGSSK